jgi:hypothetical protein
MLSVLSYPELRELTGPKLPPSSHGKAMLLVLVVVAALIVYFGWLYYREWQTKRNFRRYWQGKSRKAAE